MYKESNNIISVGDKKISPEMKLAPLKEHEFSTKLYGLEVLEKLVQETGDTVLGYRIYKDDSEFRITDFNNPTVGRLIIRTDPIGTVQKSGEWLAMPRLNLQLTNQPPSESERIVKEWMRNPLHTSRIAIPPFQFIIHKVPNIEEYDKHVSIHRLTSTDIIICVSDPKIGDEKVFRTQPALHSISMSIDKEGKVKPIQRGKLSDALKRKTIKMVELLIKFSQKTGHKSFETSYVTYNDAPEHPEYYDLIFKYL